MTKVDFSHPVEARGRNGWMQSVALDVFNVTWSNKIQLRVYTTRGCSDSAIIEIPVADIPAVIAALQKETA